MRLSGRLRLDNDSTSLILLLDCMGKAKVPTKSVTDSAVQSPQSVITKKKLKPVAPTTAKPKEVSAGVKPAALPVKKQKAVDELDEIFSSKKKPVSTAPSKEAVQVRVGAFISWAPR